VQGFGFLEWWRLEDLIELRSQFVFVQPQKTTVLAHECFGKDATGQFLKLLVFDRLKKARRNLKLVGNLIELEVTPDAFAAERIADTHHREEETPLTSKSMIQRGTFSTPCDLNTVANEPPDSMVG